MADKLPSFDIKRAGELDTFSFDLVNELGGETIVGATWHCVVSSHSPVDDPAAAAMIYNAASNLGNKTFQQIQNGVSGCLYVVTAVVTTSGGRTLEPTATLLVLDQDQ